MTPALVKFTVDLFAPGAIISTTLTNWFARHADFHSRRTLWPVEPIEELLDTNEQGSMSLKDFAHVRVTSIMDEYDGATDGELDHMLTMKPVGEIFDMPRIIGVALTLAPPYVLNTSRASWVDLYEVREDVVTFVREASVNEIHRLITEAPIQ